MKDDPMDIVERLLDRLKLKYMGDCKCGHCALVPDVLVREAADDIARLRERVAELERRSIKPFQPFIDRNPTNQ
jgi:hypothetical protein